MVVVKTEAIDIEDSKMLKNLLGQKQPALLCFYDSASKDKPLLDALNQIAKKNADDLLVLKLDVQTQSEAYDKYERPELPALVCLTKSFFGRKVKAQAANVRPKDVRSHVDFLLNDTPLPQSSDEKADDSTKKPEKDKVKAVYDDSFRAEVLKSKLPVLVDFWAPWCGPCKMISPYVEEMAGKYAGKIKFVKVNTDTTPVTVRRYEISSMPTFMTFEGGQPVGRFSGASPAGIKNLIEDLNL